MANPTPAATSPFNTGEPPSSNSPALRIGCTDPSNVADATSMCPLAEANVNPADFGCTVPTNRTNPSPVTDHVPNRSASADTRNVNVEPAATVGDTSPHTPTVPTSTVPDWTSMVPGLSTCTFDAKSNAHPPVEVRNAPLFTKRSSDPPSVPRTSPDDGPNSNTHNPSLTTDEPSANVTTPV